MHFVSSDHGRIVGSNRGYGIVFRVVGRKGGATCGMIPIIIRAANVGHVCVSPSIVVRRVAPHGNIGCATGVDTKRQVGANGIAVHVTVTSRCKSRCS